MFFGIFGKKKTKQQNQQMTSNSEVKKTPPEPTAAKTDEAPPKTSHPEKTPPAQEKTPPKEITLISQTEIDKAVLSALQTKIKTIDELFNGVKEVVTWINSQLTELQKHPEHQNLLELDNDNQDPIKIMTAETVLKLLLPYSNSQAGAKTQSQQIGAGIERTNMDNVHLYWEYFRNQRFEPVQKKYTIVISKDKNFPAKIQVRLAKQIAKQELTKLEEAENQLGETVKQEIAVNNLQPASPIKPFMEVKSKEDLPAAPPPAPATEAPSVSPEPADPPPPPQMPTENPAPAAPAGPKKPIGIFETINNLLIGDEDDE